MAFHIGRLCTRTLYRLFVAFAVLLSVLVLTLKYAVLPQVESYRGKIVASVAEATGMSVSADRIRSGWSGFRPYIELENVQFLEPASSRSDLRPPGSIALRLPRLHASLSWWALLIGQLRFDEIRLASPELALTRSKDGLVYFAGRAINQARASDDDGRLLNWLVEQSALQIDHAALNWRDDLTPGQELRFTDVGVLLEKRGDRHLLGLIATPPQSFAKKVEARGDITLDQVDGRWQFQGTVYAAATEASLAELRLHVPVPQQLQAGYGNLRVWAELDNRKTDGAGKTMNPVRLITADLYLAGASAQWDADVVPIHLSRLSGRLVYRQEEGGFTIGSKRLELRTREGVILPPADFSVTLQNQADVSKARGEIAGNDIDLKVVTALLEYFPVGKEARALATRFAPHGVIRDSHFAWSGYLDKPSGYRVKGALDRFGVKAGETSPGLDGFSGTVEGDQAGGKFTLDAKNMSVALPAYMRVPLQFEHFTGNGAWKAGAEAIEVNFDRLAFDNAGLAGELAGRYWRYRADGPRAAEEKGPGSLDIKGTLARVDARVVPDYFPNRIAVTRKYLDRAIKSGQLQDVQFSLQGQLYEFPFHLGNGGNWQVRARLNEVNFDYLDKWPVAEGLSGEVSVANTKFVGTIESGHIFNARLGRTVVAIDDLLAQPAVIAIDGTAPARAEEVIRYLRESPLVEGFGAFSKFVAIDGPGRLDLSMRVPLAGKEVGKYSGKYSLSRAQAKPSFGPQISSLGGSVAFSEAGVKSTGLAGMAYGYPINIAIGGGGGSPVTVDFLARGELAKMGDVLPFALPQQVQGTTDFKGSIAAANGGVTIRIESDLTGIASTLPPPLLKRADEARPLLVQFQRTGQPDEKIRVTLAPAAPADSRIDARFQRRFDAKGASQFHGGIASVKDAVADDLAIPEGLWLTGSMGVLDFDAWSSAYEAFYPPVADGAQTTAGGFVLAGFDFRLDSLLAYGRPFGSMTLKGRRAADVWAMSVDSADAAGDFTWRGPAAGGSGAVRARLRKLVISDEVPQAAGPAEASADVRREAHLPSIDVVADDFTFRNRWLGKLELRATPQAADWRIEQLIVSNGHARLEMDGMYQRFADAEKQGPSGSSTSRTTVNLKFEANNLNPLFNQFGYTDSIRGGTGKLEGKLSWPGHAYQFQLSNLSGEFKVEARKGQFSNIPTGAGKLLGLLSLQAIPRRLTFDFGDIFSKGFAFESIDANVRVVNGVMFTDDLLISGPAAQVKMSGQVSLPLETQSLNMTVKPRLDESVALGAGALGGPVVGVVVFALQKLLQNPVEKILSVEYQVTGTWADPVVVPVKAQTVSLPPPPPEPAKKTP